jgi:hypothetical protein
MMEFDISWAWVQRQQEKWLAGVTGKQDVNVMCSSVHHGVVLASGLRWRAGR